MKRLFLVLFVSVMLFAQGLPFIDDFSDGDYDGWIIYDIAPYSSGPSVWAVAAGCFRQTSNIYTTEAEYDVYTGTQAMTGDTGWTDYTFNVEWKSSDDDGMGLIFRARDERNYYRYLCVEDPANGGPFRRIDKCVDGVFTLLAVNASDFTWPEHFVNVSVCCIGDSMKVFDSGTLVVAASDPTYSRGKIGLTCYANNDANFDNVSVLPGEAVVTTGNLRAGPWIQMPEEDGMTIMWETTTSTHGRVYWGTTMAFTDSVDSPSTFIHEVEIDGLLPNTKYYYGVRFGDSLIAGSEYYFKTKPPDTAPVRIVIWGDNRTDYISHEHVVDAMITRDADLAINVGDVVTNGGVYSQWVIEYLYPTRNLLRNTPSYISIGNHEADSYWFDNYFAQPGNEHWFSTRFGPGYLIFMDTNRLYLPLTEQYMWLYDELSSSAAQSAPWLLVFHHHPPYSEGWDSPGYDGEENVRNFLVPLYELFDVDIVFAGHTHDYERGEKDGVAHVITGGGGAALDHWLQDWPYIFVYHAVYHYILLDMTVDYIVYRAYDWDNNLIDSTLFGTYISTEEPRASLPEDVRIVSASPNPFNSVIRIEYEVSSFDPVTVTIWDITGRQVAKIADSSPGPGKHQVFWNVERYAYRGEPVPSGIYMAVVKCGDKSDTKKIELIK